MGRAFRKVELWGGSPLLVRTRPGLELLEAPFISFISEKSWFCLQSARKLLAPGMVGAIDAGRVAEEAVVVVDWTPGRKGLGREGRDAGIDPGMFSRTGWTFGSIICGFGRMDGRFGLGREMGDVAIGLITGGLVLFLLGTSFEDALNPAF